MLKERRRLMFIYENTTPVQTNKGTFFTVGTKAIHSPKP